MNQTNPKSGLTTTEVIQLQKQHGKNKLELQKKKSLIVAFFEEFKDLMIIILIIATMISFAVGEVKDGIVIACIIIMNAIIGFIQKFRAEKAVEALKKMLAPQARVLRDHEQKIIPAENIVPGDILILNEGDLIPADALLIRANEFQTQESILTGESTPVQKELTEGKNMVFMGTMVSHGGAHAVVTKIGMETAFGKIANLTTSTEKDKSPLEKELDHVGVFVGKLTFIIAGLLIFNGIVIQKEPLAKAILFAASVAVAAVPEGLPTTITIALAIGVQRLARKNAIVKQLSSVETLGSTTVIISDKTGTLTKNEMTVQECMTLNFKGMVEGSGYEPVGKLIHGDSGKPAEISKEIEMIRTVCVLCNNAALRQNKETNQWTTLGDPTEGALLTFAQKLGLTQKQAELEYTILHELPFDSKRKRMTVIVENNGKRYAFVKGAPDTVIDVCALPEKEQQAIQEQNEEGAKRALRMIAFAYRELDTSTPFIIEEVEKNLTYLGMCGIMDPPRHEVKSAIELAKQAGIRVYILTGDHGLTATSIAEKIGLIGTNGGKISHTILTGEQLKRTSDEKVLELFHQKTPVIFARVSPEDKLRVVTLVKQSGEIVAVTGDGVNDAPALKRADIGIAMGIAGTDVSKEAANMVLADDSFSTIVTAIQEGRTIYENLKKFIMYMFSSNMGEVFVIFISIIFGLGTPLTPIIILLINIGTDVLPALALGIEPSKASYMTRPPRNPEEKILQPAFIQRLLFLGCLIGISSLSAYIIGTQWYSSEIAMTLTYVTLVFAQMINAYNSRDPVESVLKRPFSNLYLLGAIALSLTFTVATVEIPLLQRILETAHLSLNQWLLAIGLASFTLVAEEIRKWNIRRKNSVEKFSRT